MVSTTTKITTEIVATAMGMGGLSMCFSIVIISIERLHFLGSHRSLSVAFVLAAGVMTFISLADLVPEAIVFYRAHFTEDGPADPEAYEYGKATEDAGVCDATCTGHARLTMTAAFYGGMIIILIVEYIVHSCFKRRGAKRHSHGEAPPSLQKPQNKRQNCELRTKRWGTLSKVMRMDAQQTRQEQLRRH